MASIRLLPRERSRRSSNSGRNVPARKPRPYAAAMTNINMTPKTHPRADTGTSVDSGTGMRRDAAGNPQHGTNPSAGGTGRPASCGVSGCETIGSLVHNLLERIDEIQQGKRDSAPTGFRDIDSAIQGLWPGQLALIAGRPGMGESVLGLDFAQAARRQEPPAVRPAPRRLRGTRRRRGVPDPPPRSPRPMAPPRHSRHHHGQRTTTARP